MSGSLPIFFLILSILTFTIADQNNVQIKKFSLGDARASEVFWINDNMQAARTLLLRDEAEVLWIWDLSGKQMVHSKKTLAPSETIVAVSQHPDDLKRVYVIGNNGTMMYSQDYGHEFKEIKLPGRPVLNYKFSGTDILKTNSRILDYLLVLVEEHIQGNPSCGSECFDQVAYYSLDSGSTWTRLVNKARDCVWVHQHASFGGSVSETGIYCFVHQGIPDDADIKSLDPQEAPLAMFMTFDFMANRFDMFTDVVGVAVLEQYFCVLQLLKADSGDSAKNGVVWISSEGSKFAQLEFAPSLDSSPSGFTLLDAEKGNIFLDIDAQDSSPPQGVLYVSNANGTRFQRVVDNSLRSSDGSVAFTRFAKLPGRFVVSHVLGTDGKVATLHSVNDGLLWTPFRKVTNVNRDTCPDGDCALLLQCCDLSGALPGSFSGWEYDAVPGLVLASGGYGLYNPEKDQPSFFLSTDAGQSFTQVGNSSYKQMAVGSFGSLLVGLQAPSKVSYSTNSGSSWNSISVNESLTNPILTGPSGGAEDVFFVIGTAESGTGGNATDAAKLVVYLVDFRNLSNFENCNDKSGIEAWSPVSEEGDGNQCFFGSVVTHSRRKPGESCRLTASHIKRVNSNPCACTRSDFECDVGFYKSDSEHCLSETKAPMYESECNGDRRYQLSGYRKQALSSCVGGLLLDVSDKYVACAGPMSDGTPSLSFGNRLLVFTALLGLVGMITAVFYTWVFKGRASSHRSGAIRLPIIPEDGPFLYTRSARFKHSVQRLGDIGIDFIAGVVKGTWLMATSSFNIVRNFGYRAIGRSRAYSSARYQYQPLQNTHPFYSSESEEHEFAFQSSSSRDSSAAEDEVRSSSKRTSLPTTTGRLVDLIGDDESSE